MQHADVFKKNYLVHGLPDSAIEEIAALAECNGGLAGEVIVNKGEKSSDLFVILDGTVNILSDKGDKLAEVGPGAVLGEIALVDAGPRSADAVCKGLVHYAKLPAKELRAYMAKNKDAGFVMLANLARVLSMRLRNTSVAVEDLRAKTEDPWKGSL
jgi:CRP/FNR family cyclic AMP-dependent transcriptional regulator